MREPSVKLKARRSPFAILIAVFVGLLLFGLASTVSIVSREGVDGLFKRKRDAVKQVMPEALPIVDKVEDQVRGPK